GRDDGMVTQPRPARTSNTCYMPSTVSIPDSTNCSLERGTLPTLAVRRLLSTLTIWDTFGSPVRRVAKWAFPGAKGQLRLLVNGTQTTVATRLRFKASPCTTSTGLVTLDRSLLGQEGLPTISRLARLPLAPLQDAARG